MGTVVRVLLAIALVLLFLGVRVVWSMLAQDEFRSQR